VKQKEYFAGFCHGWRETIKIHEIDEAAELKRDERSFRRELAGNSGGKLRTLSASLQQSVTNMSCKITCQSGMPCKVGKLSWKRTGQGGYPCCRCSNWELYVAR
jgi:hypothetical protein